MSCYCLKLVLKKHMIRLIGSAWLRLWEICLWLGWLELLILIHRGIIPQISNQCVYDFGQSKSANHMFVGCAFYGNIWMHLHIWQAANKLSILDHFQHFTYLTVDFSDWVLWRTLQHLVYRVKFASFIWLRASNSNLTFDFHHWWPISPSVLPCFLTNSFLLS